MQVRHDTPHNVLSDYYAAYRERDFAAMLACTAPSQRSRAAPALELADEHWEAVCELANAIATHEDSRAAELFMKRQRPILPFPMEEAVSNGELGELDWASIEIERKDKTAGIVVDGIQERDVKLERVNDQWYVSHVDAGNDLPLVGALFLRMFYGPGIQKLRDVTRKLKEEPVPSWELYDYILPSPDVLEFGPVTDNLSIGLRLIDGPTHTLSEPFTFEVYWEWPDIDDPRVWKMPMLGLGEGVVVELDGQEVGQPTHTADTVRGIQHVHGFGKWWFTLPPSVDLSVGLHTIRYSFESVNDEGLDPAAGTVLKGRVSSPPLVFYAGG
jgi:hypothetical protein